MSGYLAQADAALPGDISVSFEFFPPKTDEAQRVLVSTLRELEPLKPSFVSVTYGAGGATRDRTHDIVVGLLRTTSMTPMAHLTCAAHSRLDLAEILVRYGRVGVENLLLLGGDPPKDGEDTARQLRYAEDLVDLARSISDFSIGVAAHPEVHPRSPDRVADRARLAQKLSKSDFAVTQFFFRSDDYFTLVDELAAIGVRRPVIPGVMPITNLSSVARMAEMSGATIPEELLTRLRAAEERGGADAVREVGIDAATELSRTLLAGGAPGLHFYTMNRSGATLEIYDRLRLDRSAEGVPPRPQPRSRRPVALGR
jgi:methylenetetrahydrofolate reductase (NADPH)